MFVYTPHFIPSSIILFGAGGTGSRLMPQMAQLVRTCVRKFNPLAWLERLPIYVIDGDRVEDKNLMRQNFIARDVGQYKANVLANRYSNAFDIPIYAGNFFLGSGPEGANNIIGYDRSNIRLTFEGCLDPLSFRNAVIILAVDSASARRSILNFISRAVNSNLFPENKDTGNLFIIDAGNEDTFGQVKFFTNNLYVKPRTMDDVRPYIREIKAGSPINSPISHDVKYIPFDRNYYNNLGESNHEKSCAELPQTLAINSMMASMICSVLQNFLYLKPMNYDCIRFGLDGGVHCERNSLRSWVDRVEALVSHARTLQYYLRNVPEHSNVDPFIATCHIHSEEDLTFLKSKISSSLKAAKLIIDEQGNIVPKIDVLPPAPLLVPLPTPLSAEEVLKGDGIKKAPSKKPIKKVVFARTPTEELTAGIENTASQLAARTREMQEIDDDEIPF